MTASGHARDGSDQLRWKKGTGRRYKNSDTHEQSGKPVAAASPRKVSRSRVEQMAGEETHGLREPPVRGENEILDVLIHHRLLKERKRELRGADGLAGEARWRDVEGCQQHETWAESRQPSQTSLGRGSQTDDGIGDKSSKIGS